MLSFLKEDFLLRLISNAEGEAQECKWRHWSRGHSGDIQSPVDCIMEDTGNHILQDFSAVMLGKQIIYQLLLLFCFGYFSYDNIF